MTPSNTPLQIRQDDPAAILDIKEDIRIECSKLGTVTNVVLYDLEPDGVATVRFSTEEAAQACVRMMRGRKFSGLTVQADIADGGEKFKKSGTGEEKAGGGERDDGGDGEGERLEQFGSWLEEDGGGGAK